MSSDDKASLKAERLTDGTLKVTMRGDVYDGRTFIKSVMGGANADTKQRAPRHQRPRSRRQDRRGRRLPRRGAARARSAAAEARRPDQDLRAQRQARRRRDAARRHARPRRRPPGAVLRELGRGRAAALHRHLSAHGRRPDVGHHGPADAEPGAAGGPAQHPRFRGARRAGARQGRRGRRRPAAVGRRVLAHAGRVHPLARPLHGARRGGARARRSAPPWTA